jgi:hypothetical protein
MRDALKPDKVADALHDLSVQDKTEDALLVESMIGSRCPGTELDHRRGLGASKTREGRSKWSSSNWMRKRAPKNEDIGLARLLAGVPASGGTKPVTARLYNVSRGSV